MRAGVWPLPDDATYVNVGTWVPEGEDSYFVYFAVAGEGDERAGRLWRWNKRQCEPEPFGTPSAGADPRTVAARQSAHA